MAGLPGDWRIRETPFTGHLTGVASAPGQLIAVGRAGAILSSGDGRDWSRVAYDGSGDFHCVAFGNGIYVTGGTFDCLLATSPDGVNWTTIQTTAGQQAHFGVTYGAGRFVAVGRGGLLIPTRIFSSTNGIDWQPASVPPTTNTLRSVTFGNGKYVAVGERGTIVTSPDALTWTLQISGTEHHLRSVIFTGWEFLAGGDSSILLTSEDGISWSTVPFSSFDLRALTTSGTAVVGVGMLGSEGRIQASPHGFAWSDGASTLPSRLNAVTHYGLGRFVAVGNGGLIVDSAAWADSPVNVWAKTSDGYWDEWFWTLGHIPSWNDTSIVFTNAGSKTLEIDATTTRDYPESMRVRKLVLGGAPGSHNGLFLHGGLDVPLLIDNPLRILANASLFTVGSILETPALDLSGNATLSHESQTRIGSVTLRGQLHLAGGAVTAADIFFQGGSIKAHGSYALGRLVLPASGTVDFEAGPTTLRFDESSDTVWNSQSFLTVTNWAMGTDRLFTGHNQTGLTAAQLSRIRFANPGGFSPGLYSARITSTGEVVPVPRLITYQRGASQLILNWPEGYRLLTATNVAGPYSLITNAISPYNASYHTDPQRFFIIGNEN